jgi:uncharacterized membrane protein
MIVHGLLLVVAAILTGLIAGLLYGFTVAVIPGLRVVSAREHIRAMQMINIKIVNPLFLLSFLGAAVVLVLAALLLWGSTPSLLLLAATGVHLVGVIVVTAAGNVPLNNRLAAVNAEALTAAEAENVRQEYHGRGARWMTLHHIRTLAAAAALALVTMACLAYDAAG